MKKIAVLFILLFSLHPAWAGPSSVSTYMGANLFNYNLNYLTMGLTYLNDLGQGMEFNLGVDFDIATTKEATGGKTIPRFLVPVSIGANFLFPIQPWTFGLGVGLTPNFSFSNSSDYPFEFYLGPYIKGMMRVKIHPVMSLFVSAQQDLIIGGSTWINTGTRLDGGIIFNLGANSSR